jgi:proteic killer suppression protein
MDVTFSDDDLEKLERDPEAKSRLDGSIVRAFRRLMGIIRDARDERDLRALKSLHFEKLK